MTPARRRWGWALAAVVLVALLAGGRWAALGTAERLWAATIPAGGGQVYLDGRGLAALFRVAIFVIAVAWATGNLYLVSRTIGAVQLPRRLGDLDIVETVSRGALHLAVIGGGLVVGLVLTWGTGDWWLAAVLAAEPPRFGIADPVLGRDLGYYVATLRWTGALQNHVLLAVASVTVVVVLLYIGIGAIGWQGARLRAGLRARLHLGVLLAGLAAVLAWGALLDPAEVVGGLHGPVDAPALRVRLPGAGAVVGLAVAAAIGSLVWLWTGRGGVVVGVWGGLLAALPIAYLMAPSVVRGPRGARATAVMDRDTRDLTERAFGLRWLAPELPLFTDPADAVAGLPLWDGERVARVARLDRVLGARASVGGVALLPRAAPAWLVGPATDETALRETRPVPSWSEIHAGGWATQGPPLVATEVDSGLAFLPVASSPTRFGPGTAQFAVLPAGVGSVPGIVLAGRWRRWALAWALQSTDVAGAAVEGGTLLWRRDAGERLARLAPFATFGAARPMLADGALWWVAPGYVTSPAFPLIRALDWRGERVRYVHAGFVGAMHAATGETRLVLAPGYDSLSVAWARAFAPLVQPSDSLPAALRAQLPPPADGFTAALAAALRVAGDTAWTARPQTPYEVIAPPPGAAPGTVERVPWLAQAFVTGTPPRVAAVFASAMSDGGPTYVLWRPDSQPRAPAPVAGSSDTRGGQLRLWPGREGLASAQAQFAEGSGPTGAATRPRLATVYVTWGARSAEGPSRGAALAALLAGETSVTAPDPARWRRARRLLTEADSALRAGDMARFGRLYDELRRLFGIAPGALAPPGGPR